MYKANLKRDVKEVKVAIKTIRRYTSEKETQDFIREMNIMADMMHPNIIQLYGLVNEGQSLQGAFSSLTAQLVKSSFLPSSHMAWLDTWLV